MFEWMSRKSRAEKKAQRSSAPKYSYDKKVERTLQQWERLKDQDRFLVHGVTLDKFERGPLSKRQAEEVLNTWDVFSTSLIDVKRIAQARHHDQKKGGERSTQLFGEVGFILEVPPQNILGTFPQDVMFPTHFRAKDFAFADAIFNGTSKFGWIKMVERYNKVLPPDDVVGKTLLHNEVLVVGKSNVKIYFPLTQAIKVVGVIYAPRYLGGGLRRMSFERLVLLGRLRQLNPALDIIIV
ncbi:MULTISPECIES: hypothetical protein [Pseudomonas]|uniref:Uncharacterized protein n=1 Tax=Pseudomonas putida TaxID=303 RepID=A0A1B2F119_PSEPU|nr:MULTISPECIES: hypothetical protein [Pseudomonas]ANY85940.1 hypothetical protein IEC33019_0336 [Pseudomonas putida]MCL8308130.1 hypothetical protein [Pseudomonas putida]